MIGSYSGSYRRIGSYSFAADHISSCENGSLVGIFIAVVLLVVYGSLYPWQFVARELPASPLWLLFHSWEVATGRRFLADIIVNIAIYVPVGMFGFLAFRRFRYAGPIVFGAVLSGCIEMTQLYTPSRQCSTVDLATNIAGSILGVLAGILFERIGGPVRVHVPGGRDRAALGLLFCWVASLLFPLFPETSLPSMRSKLFLFVYSAWLSPLPLISSAACWYAAGLMMRSRVWLALSLLLIPAQLLVVTRQPLAVQLVGAIAGTAAFAATGRRWLRWFAWSFPGLLAIRGLAPFHLSFPQFFFWMPFSAFLGMEWQAAIGLMLEKLFYYGAAIWLMRQAGVRWAFAIGGVCVLLAAIEATQVYLPGRTPEVTDPLLALLAGFGLHRLAIMRIHDQCQI
jgi:VanZ family protein